MGMSVAGKRAGIYTRISKWDGEGESLGVQRQDTDCRAEAQRRGWEVVDVYSDDDKSAYSGKPRREYIRLCDDLKAGTIDAVIVWDVDRLHRSPRELEDFVTLIEATGAAVVSVSGGDYDLETADGRFKARIMGAVARKESEDKSRRLLRKHAQLAEDGQVNGGGRPIGYRRVGLKKDPTAGGADTRQLVVDPVEAPIVAEIIERMARGETLTRVADDLNERGVPTTTGAKWGLWAIRRVALNGLYAGFRMHKGVEVAVGDWPAIVDEATWRRAVALLNAPDRPKQRAARRSLLTGGIVVCGKCLAEGRSVPMKSKPHHDRAGKTVSSYGCPPKRLGGCCGVSVRAELLEELVKEAVIELVESAAFAESLHSRKGGDRKAAAEVTKITAELLEYEQAKTSGAISLREYLKFRDAAQARLGVAQGRMAGDTSTSAVGRFAGQAGTLRAWWENPATTLDRKQAVVRSVISRVVVAPVGKRGGSSFDERRVTIERVI